MHPPAAGHGGQANITAALELLACPRQAAGLQPAPGAQGPHRSAAGDHWNWHHWDWDSSSSTKPATIQPIDVAAT